VSIALLSFVSAQGPYTLSFNLSQFEFSVENGYDRVKGMEMVRITDTGAPELPCKSLNFILPNGIGIQDIVILSLTLVPLEGTYNIYPSQPPHPITLDPTEPPPFVPPDSEIYSVNALYPDSVPIEIIHKGSIDGIPFVTIAMYPLLYNPVKESIYVIQSVTFRFVLETVPYSQRPQIMGERVFKMKLNSLQDCVYNHWEVVAYYTAPPLIPDEELLSRQGCEVVIVTAPTMTAAYQPLAKWLVEKGMPCMIVSTDWIYAMYDGQWTTADYAGWSEEHIGDDAAKIKEFLYDMHWSSGLAFAILGGISSSYLPMTNWVPFRYCDGMPSDLYFQDFTGNWMNNPDYQEEIWIGRIPAWNYDQTLSWVEKRLNYEKSPENKELMNHSLWITQGHQPDCIEFPSLMNQTIPYFPSHIVQHLIVNHPSNANDHEIIDFLSTGYGFVSTCGHGGTDGQRTAYPDYRQLLMSWPWNYNNMGIMPNLSELHNANKYFIVYAINCDNAWYDDMDATGHYWSEQWSASGPLPCMAEAYSSFYRLDVPPDQRPPIGAVAFLGNTRSGQAWGSPELQRNFINRLFYFDTLIGVAEAKARYAGPYGWLGWYFAYVHNLFGSPEMPVWTDNPKTIIAYHPHSIPVNTPVDFEVAVYEDPVGPQQISLQDALVTLYKAGPEIYQSQKTNAEGRVYFSGITVATTGVMKVTITKKNYIPYQADVQVFEFAVTLPTTHTEFTEGRKLIRQPNSTILNLAYTYGIGGADIPQEWTTFSTSTDGGTIWLEGQNVLPIAPNHNPSIGLMSDNRPCLAFRKSIGWLVNQSAVIYFARYDAPNWTVYTVDSYPAIPTSFYPSVSPPAIRIDANDICHMVYSGVLFAPGKAYVVYKRFDCNNPGTETVIIDSANVPVDWQPSSPSIDIQYGYPHIVYDFPPQAGEPYPDIWYKCLTTSGWSDPVNISNSYSQPSEHPYLLITNEKALVVWSEEESEGNEESREIWKGERFLNQPPSNWTTWREVETPNQASDWPILTVNDRLLVWSEHLLTEGNKNWEIMYQSPYYGSGNISNSSCTQSRYASCDWRQTLTSIDLYSAYTERYEEDAETNVFGIQTKRNRLQYIPVPKYTIYAGSEYTSAYLIQRDGYIAYENYPVDYDTTEIIYKFSGLKPELKYKLDITAYHESQGEWREWVKIDNTAQHMVKYQAEIPTNIELPVPSASYKDDGEITVRISKIYGDFAACHMGHLYEFEKESEGGGPQSVDAEPMNLEFGIVVLPSILIHTALIRYVIPTRQQVKLTLYDITGRKAIVVADGIMEAGVHTFNFDSSNLSAGIYFLILEGEKETTTKKVLVVR